MDEKRIEQIAKKIVSLGMAAPCVFLLEAHIPFSSVFHTVSLALEPLAAPIVGSQRVGFLSEFFSDRENVECLIREIEQQEAAKA